MSEPGGADDLSLDLAMEASATAGELDEGQLEDVVHALLAPTEPRAIAARQQAGATLGNAFPQSQWGIGFDTNPFSEDGLLGLYRNEIPGDFRAWLSQEGIGPDDYAQDVMPVQFNAISIWASALFSGRAKANKGWRIRLLGFPSLDTIAVGISSHYQGSQSQKILGSASALIRDAALGQLALNPTARDALRAYPAATAEHWDGRGLMPEPIRKVGTLDITGYGKDGAQLRMARNTTAKKDIAAFFGITGMNRDGFLRSSARLSALRQIATTLAGIPA